MLFYIVLYYVIFYLLYHIIFIISNLSIDVQIDKTKFDTATLKLKQLEAKVDFLRLFAHESEGVFSLKSF